MSQPAEVIHQAEIDRGAETLDPGVGQSVAQVYGIAPPAGELESHTLVERRRAEVAQALGRADELETEALARADAAKEAHARADQAARDADAAEREAQQVREQALAARREADAAEAAEARRPVNRRLPAPDA